MSRAALVLALVAALLAPASAVQYITFEQVTVAASAIGLTAAKITPPGLLQATSATCRLETAEIRYRLDGGTPTPTVGTLLEPGDALTLSGHDVLVAFLAIRTTGASGLLSCTESNP